MTNTPILVLRRDKRRKKTDPVPCEIRSEYTIDYGATWMSEKEYREYKNSFINEIDFYGYQREKAHG